MKRLKQHLPWTIFAAVFALSFSAMDEHALDAPLRQAADAAPLKQAWIEGRTQAMKRSELGHLSNIQRVLEVTRGPSSLKKLE